MSIVVLLILAIVWAVFLIPQAVRFRTEKRPADSIGAFHRQLTVLGRATPGGRPAPTIPAPTAHVPVYAAAVRPVAGVPARRATGVSAEVRRRRRAILQGLLAVMGGTLLLGLTPWLRPLLFVHLVVDVLFAAYVALLVRARTVAEERRSKVRFLPATGSGSAETALLLRRSAN